MSNNLEYIHNAMQDKRVKSRLAMALGLDPKKDNAEVTKYCASVLAEIEKSTHDSKNTHDLKKDLTGCAPDSIVQCMIDAARFGLMIDGRQHAHIIKYGCLAQMQIGYRGYMYLIKKKYPDADFTVAPIYDGDDLVIKEENGAQLYTLERKNPMQDSEELLQGVLVAVSYTDPSSGRLIQKVTPVPRSRIDRARSTARHDGIWQKDFIEKAKAAAIKNACKHMFATVTALQDAIAYDNEMNSDVIEHEPAKVLDNQDDEFTQADMALLSNKEEDAPIDDKPFICPETGELIE